MTRPRRIVVTGLGSVSALGATAEASWQGARDGVCAIRPTLFDPGPNGPGSFTLPAAKVAPGYATAMDARMGRKVSGMLDPFALMQLTAAHEALDQAGLIGHGSLNARTAVVVGQGMSGVDTAEKNYERFFGQKLERMHPAMVPKIMVSAPASAVAMQFGIHGPVFATSSACASSAHAMIQGAMLIAAGLADVAVVGGSECVVTPGSMRGWIAIQALAEGPCRPFSRDRDGMSIAEGGAALVLESLEHAEKRGARPLGEYLGGGMSSDAGHITQPSLEGPVAAMRQAVGVAGVQRAEEIMIAAHGTGTVLNDRNETAALREIFGSDALARHPVIATKSAHGHLIGGSAAMQAVIALRALEEGLAPPILNYLGPDPDCDLNLVTGEARPIQATHLLLNAFAFGGLNAALVFQKWSE
jgi:nodulation protein E